MVEYRREGEGFAVMDMKNHYVHEKRILYAFYEKLLMFLDERNSYYIT
jgi:hypothetical protein